MSYDLRNEPIDVIIPCTAKDKETLNLCIEGIKKYGKDIRRVIVVSDNLYTENAEWFDEKLYPFSKKDIALYLFSGQEQAAKDFMTTDHKRLGWIYQQLLKLYAYIVIPGLSSNLLILDADTIFLNPISFLTEDGAGLYSTGTENYRPYFEHAKRLLPGFKKVFRKTSGISHHMLFQKSVLDDLFFNIQRIHQCEPWKAIVKCFDMNVYHVMSEYEIYFNYAFSKTNQVKLRPCKWTNSSDPDSLQTYKNLGYDYFSCHAYMRE